MLTTNLGPKHTVYNNQQGDWNAPSVATARALASQIALIDKNVNQSIGAALSEAQYNNPNLQISLNSDYLTNDPSFMFHLLTSLIARDAETSKTPYLDTNTITRAFLGDKGRTHSSTGQVLCPGIKALTNKNPLGLDAKTPQELRDVYTRALRTMYEDEVLKGKDYGSSALLAPLDDILTLIRADHQLTRAETFGEAGQYQDQRDQIAELTKELSESVSEAVVKIIDGRDEANQVSNPGHVRKDEEVAEQAAANASELLAKISINRPRTTPDQGLSH
jgi:hypothetical protein